MEKWSQDIYFKAYWFAAEVHNGQLLPDTTLPYIVHPGMVCMEVMATLQAEAGHGAVLAVPYALLEAGEYTATSLLDDSRVEKLTVLTGGRFSGYVPLAEIPPYGTVVILLER